MEIGIIGSGSWGTALAMVLARNGHSVTIWGRNATAIEKINVERENKDYLPGIRLLNQITLVSSLERVLDQSEVILVVIPSECFREFASRIKTFSGILVSCTKGIEHQTGMTMSAVLKQECPDSRLAVLSGPSLASEVALDIPAAVVVASEDIDVSQKVQSLLHRPAFRVYTSDDVVGVELGGALKNVIAIAAGMCDGLSFGDNSKAALITRAIVEITRLGAARNARGETFSGLSGLGDLVVTCFSKLSRNRTFGEKLAQGHPLDELLHRQGLTVEGYPTARSAFHLARMLGVQSPIIDQVYEMLYLRKDLSHAVKDLLTRESKPETDALGDPNSTKTDN